MASAAAESANTISTPATPGGGVPCPIVLAALIVLFGGSLYLAVHLIVWAVS